MIYLFYNECELLKLKNLIFYIKISIKKISVRQPYVQLQFQEQ